MSLKTGFIELGLIYTLTDHFTLMLNKPRGLSNNSFFLVNQSDNQTCSHWQFKCGGISEKSNAQLFTLLQNIPIWLNTQCIIICKMSPKNLELRGFQIFPFNSVLFLPTTLLINLIKSVQIRERAVELRWSMVVFLKQEKDTSQRK